MGYLKNFGINYQSLTELSEFDLAVLVNKMSREDLIEWLSWNDPNGIYHDAQSLEELGNIMSLEEGQEILLRQVRENRVLA